MSTAEINNRIEVLNARALDAEERGDFQTAKVLWAAASMLREKLA